MFKLPAVFHEDVQKIIRDTISQYERDAGKTLQPAHIERLLINTYAYRESLMRQQANHAYRQGFPQFASGAALDCHGEQVGAKRLSAKPALTTIEFSIDRTKYQGEVIIEWGAVVSAGEVLFKTLKRATIAATAESANVNAECLVDGVVGNGLTVGTVNVIETASITPASLSASDIKVKNTTITNSGTDVESDEDYLVRILAAPEAFTTGTKGAYAYHARSVSPLIIDVNVDNPIGDDGMRIGGKVDITILTKNGMPTEDLIAKAQSYCSNEKRRDLCDTVTVKAPVLQPFSVVAELVLLNKANQAEVLATANAVLNDELTKNSQKLGRDIVPLDIAKTLKVDGVYDVRLVQPASIIVVAENSWAQCSSVSITVATETMVG